jgi:hypothetical protein
MSYNGETPETPTLADVRTTLERDGHHPVLLYIDKGSKRPSYLNWSQTTYEKTLEPSYRRFLERYSIPGSYWEATITCARLIATRNLSWQR